jgi:hydroxymethylpyrimidine pyrophosphatase-like HAD family hydrolase
MRFRALALDYDGTLTSHDRLADPRSPRSSAPGGRDCSSSW